MTEIDQTIGPDFETRMSDVLHTQDLLLPGYNEKLFIDETRFNLEKWLKNKDVYYSGSGLWLEHETNTEIVGDFEEVWQIHFTPPYVVSETIDGRIISREVAIYESQADSKYMTILAGLTGIVEYVASIEADYLPKPDLIYGVTNKEMAKLASRRLGFEMGKPLEDNTFLVVTDFDLLKSATRKFIKKFGSKVVGLGLDEIEASGILND